MYNKRNLIFATVLIIFSFLAFLYGKGVGNKEGLIGGANACKYLCEATASPKPTSVQPSERSLKAAAWVYTHSSQESLTEMKNEHPECGGTPQSITKCLALWYDQSPESLALVEADMKKAGD